MKVTKEQLQKDRAGDAAGQTAPADNYETVVDRRFIWCANTGDKVTAVFCGLRQRVIDDEIRQVVDLDVLEHNLTCEQAKEQHVSMYCKGNLYRRLEAANLKVGDKVRIIYNGKTPSKTQYGLRDCHDYTVAVSRS